VEARIVSRQPEIDMLRGLMLVLITITHVPTHYSGWITQPVGYVSAAEGFVFLSAYLVGAVYTRHGIQHGLASMRTALWHRAGLIWLCQAGMLLFLFTVIAHVGLRTNRQAIKNLISFYLDQPIDALWSGLALIYNPPLLDILPMYVLFMLASPLALSLGLLARGWYVVVGTSLALWLLAQLGFTGAAYAAMVKAVDLKVPLDQTGSFELAAWQFIWILGMWMGSWRASVSDLRAIPGWVAAAAAAFALGCMVWRHAAGLAPFGPDQQLNLLFDKWHLGPLRLLNFIALLVVAVRFGPWLTARVRFPWLETLGQASLPVFCAQIVAVLIVLSAIGDRHGEMPLWADTVLLAVTLAGLYAVALVSKRVSREQRDARALTARTAG
jgi:hypothetical protein